MEFLPLFHNLRGSRVLVVGGGEIALRKSRLIADAGAVLRVVAPEIEAQLSELVVQSGGEMILRGYSEGDLDGCVLIIAATDDEPLNAQVSHDARLRCVPVNVVDAPALCTVIFPAIVDRSPLVIAVSSGGDAPVLARLIRAKLETWIPSTYGQLAGLAARFRNQVKGLFPNVQQRRAFWEDVFQGAIADRQLAGQVAEAERLLIAKIAGEPPPETGEVYLVGAGPGDPDLLTFRALRLMQQADVVLYDRLVAPTILDLCRRDAERVSMSASAVQSTLFRRNRSTSNWLHWPSKASEWCASKAAIRLSSAVAVRKSKSWLRMAFRFRWFRVLPPPVVVRRMPVYR